MNLMQINHILLRKAEGLTTIYIKRLQKARFENFSRKRFQLQIIN